MLKDEYEYRLLDENEWEAAASGHERREYPWGNGWDKNKCNNRELEINKTSPVGVFKEGNTPEGISDLSGNVWEWTDSWYDGDKGTKVLRGGSWIDHGDLCRCAYRSSDVPSLERPHRFSLCQDSYTLGLYRRRRSGDFCVGHVSLNVPYYNGRIPNGCSDEVRLGNGHYRMGCLC